MSSIVIMTLEARDCFRLQYPAHCRILKRFMSYLPKPPSRDDTTSLSCAIPKAPHSSSSSLTWPTGSRFFLFRRNIQREIKTWSFIFERARPLSLYMKGISVANLQMGNFERGTKAKTRGKKGHDLFGLVIPGRKFCSGRTRGRGGGAWAQKTVLLYPLNSIKEQINYSIRLGFALTSYKKSAYCIVQYLHRLLV